MLSWKDAFKVAVEVALEGERHANIDPNDSTFCRKAMHPPSNKLALFVETNEIIRSYCSEKCTKEMLGEGTIDADENNVACSGISATDNLRRQLCRQWLKFKYLSLGTECLDAESGLGVCGRMHKFPSTTGLLYNDYSFKGLSKAHRRMILDAAELVCSEGDSKPEARKRGGENVKFNSVTRKKLKQVVSR